MKNKLEAAFFLRVGSIEQLDGQLEDVHIPGKMEENRKDVLIYCRVARNDNDEINFQRNQLIDCAYDKGFYVKGIFQDIGSGLDFDREGLTALLAAIEKEPVDYVLVKDISRIGRDVFSTLQFTDKLEEMNVKVFCAALNQEHQTKILNDLIEACLSNEATKEKTPYREI